MLDRHFTHHNAGSGGTQTWYGLIRLQKDVIVYTPSVVYIDFAVNDANVDRIGSHLNGYASCAEALIRRLRMALPNARLYCWILTWPDDYSYMTSNFRAARDKWINLANTYNLVLLRYDIYLESLMPSPYLDADVEAYLNTPGDVHPNDAGYRAAADLAIKQAASLVSNNLGELPPRVFPESVDYEATPIIRMGVDNDGETGTWSTTGGTKRTSSETDAAIYWTGNFCSFGLDTNCGEGAGTIAWQVDDGPFKNKDLSATPYQAYLITNFAKGDHTITVKVISGTVTVNRFLAI